MLLVAFRGHNNGVVMSNRPLKDNEYFEVKLDKIVALPTTYTMDIGVTTNAPEKLNFPQTMTDCEHGKTWMFCGSRVVLNKAEIERFTKITLDDLKVCKQLVISDVVAAVLALCQIFALFVYIKLNISIARSYSAWVT